MKVTYTKLISIEAAAAHADVSIRTIRRWISEGRLPASRVGPRLIKIDTTDLDELIRPVTVR